MSGHIQILPQRGHFTPLSDKLLDKLTGQTWLQKLNEAVNNHDADLFRKRVLEGLVRLRFYGLLSLLGLPANADVELVRDALHSHIGRMYGDRDGNEYQAMWWDGVEPPNIKRKFRCRVFPNLEPEIQAQLGKGDPREEIDYHYVGLDIIGFQVLAAEGLTLSDSSDTVSNPAWLLRPFVPLVSAYANNKLSLVAAGVGGEALYMPALKQAGLTQDLLERLGEFYELFDPYDVNRPKKKSVV